MLNIIHRFNQLLYKMPFYAVAKGKNPGIYHTWDECKANVSGIKYAVYKKFSTEQEAEDFIQEKGSGVIDKRIKSNNIANDNRANLSMPIKIDNKKPLHNQTDDDRPILIEIDDDITPKIDTNNAGRLSPTLLRMKKDMKKLQKDCIKLREEFEEYIAKKNGEQIQKKVNKKKDKATNGECSITEIHNEEKRKQSQANGECSLAKKPKLFNNNVCDKNSFTVNSDGFLVVYTDGACSNNGRASAKAGVGVYFGKNHPMNVSEPVDGRQTNNTAEIQAAIFALELGRSAGFDKIQINTDSQFMINCMTMWFPSWKKNGWKKRDGGEIKNLDELQKLDRLSDGLMVKWNHVAAHVGLEGNEAADALARAGALK